MKKLLLLLLLIPNLVMALLDNEIIINLDCVGKLTTTYCSDKLGCDDDLIKTKIEDNQDLKAKITINTILRSFDAYFATNYGGHLIMDFKGWTLKYMSENYESVYEKSNAHMINHGKTITNRDKIEDKHKYPILHENTMNTKVFVGEWTQRYLNNMWQKKGSKTSKIAHKKYFFIDRESGRIVIKDFGEREVEFFEVNSSGELQDKLIQNKGYSWYEDEFDGTCTYVPLKDKFRTINLYDDEPTAQERYEKRIKNSYKQKF